MLKKGLLFIAAASVFLSFAVPSWACDTSCPISHRKGHLAPWEQLVEKSFGIPAGFGQALMTESEWIEQKVLMAGMRRDERQAHKKEMNLALLSKAEEQGLTIPVFGKSRSFRNEKVMPFEYKGANTKIAVSN